MDEIIVEGVRCFYERQSIPLRKLTVLVGENSSGKSTFLALTRIAWSVAQGEREIDFNEEPFLLGAFDQIASLPKGRARAIDFTVGMRFKNLKIRDTSSDLEVVGTFVKTDAQPALGRWSVGDKDYEIFTPDFDSSSDWYLSSPTRNASLAWGEKYQGQRIGIDSLIDLIDLPVAGVESLLNVGGSLPTSSEREYLGDMLQAIADPFAAKPYAFAPIQSQPRRTYDPLREAPEPQGSHVPMVLARISSGEPQKWQQLVQALRRFGKSSGLFADVEVRRMAKGEGEPFQIRVKVSDAAFNLVDVGYGVSQILPIIVDVLILLCQTGSPGRGTRRSRGQRFAM